MKVKLIAHTPDPEKLIATAAKLCYSSSSVDDLQIGLTEEKIKKFLDMLMELGHESPLEHASFTFAIEGISRACSHQLVRHRIASYSQKSQRYVSEAQFDYVIPETIKNNPVARDLYNTLMTTIQLDYDAIRDVLIKDFMSQGISKKDAEKIANEDARMVLPNACETSIIVTMNIRSLFNFFKHRCCNRAQWEIRALAMEMWHLCMEVAPLIFQHAGPECITKGKCPEGNMSCGKPPIMCHGERSHPSPDKETPNIKNNKIVVVVSCKNPSPECAIYAIRHIDGSLSYDCCEYNALHPIVRIDEASYKAYDISDKCYDLVVKVDVGELPPIVDEK